MAFFTVKSKRGERVVYVSDEDLERVLEYAFHPWHIVWKADKPAAVATSVTIGPRLGTKYGRRTRQVKLHEYIMGEIPHCKGIRHRDGDPLNNTRQNLAQFQVYHTEKLDYAKKGKKRADICIGCINENTCRKVPTRKKITTEVNNYEN